MMILLAACSAWGRCPGAIAVPAQRIAQLQRLLSPPPAKAKEPNKTEFRVYADVTSPDQRARLVLYSYNSPPPDQYSDSNYAVFLAVLSGTGATEKVESNSDITKLMPISTEGEDDAGSISDFDGCLTPFSAPGDQMLHVNLWSLISGNGVHNATSDFFFRLTDTLELRRVLELKETGRWGSMGMGYALNHDSTIAVVGATVISPLEVLHQIRHNDLYEGKRGPFTDYKVYRWNGARFDNGTVLTAQQFAGKMKHARVLSRSTGQGAAANSPASQQPASNAKVPSK